MGNPFSATSVNSYNANPPADDGSQVAANLIAWSTIKSKLPDPIKTAFDTSETNTNTAFSKIVGGAGVTTTAVDYTVLAADQGKLVKCTVSGKTITTPDATVVGAPFVFGFSNTSTGNVTFAGNNPGVQQNVDGAASITVPASKGIFVYTDGTNWFTVGQNWGTLPRGYIDGLVLSNAADAANDITVAVGSCRDSTNTVDLNLNSALTKQIDASWVAGTNAGGRSSAGLADDTWHLFLIGKASGAAVDVLFHNAVDPTAVLPSGYLYFRILGSVVRASSSILAFTQYDNGRFELVTPVQDIAATNAGTSAVTRTLASAPTDIKIRAIVRASMVAGTSGHIACLLTSLDSTDVAPDEQGASGANLVTVNAGVSRNSIQVEVMTNTSAQIRSRQSLSGGADVFYIVTVGWIHPRGRDA